MPKKGLAANRRRRRARKNPSTALANPPVGQDLTHLVLPGFAAYAATRFFSRIIYSLVQKRWPRFGKHAGALAAATSFGGMWFFAHKVKRVAPYHDGILIGSGVAALQTIARTYLPGKYAYIVSDYTPDQIANGTGARQVQAPTTATAAEVPESQEWDDEYSHLEAELDSMEAPAPRRRRSAVAAATAATPVPAPNASIADFLTQTAGDDLDADLVDELDDDEDLDDMYAGSFAENTLN